MFLLVRFYYHNYALLGLAYFVEVASPIRDSDGTKESRDKKPRGKRQESRIFRNIEHRTLINDF